MTTETTAAATTTVLTETAATTTAAATGTDTTTATTTGSTAAPAAGSPEAIAAEAAAAAAGETKTPEQIAADEAAALDAAGAPEKYTDFVAPANTVLDQEVVSAFSDVARELNLPQAKAQLLIDKVSPIIAARQSAEIAATQEAWLSATTTDAEFGGAKLDESKVLCARAMTQFATPELRAMLNDTGLGNHPELVRFMVRAGKAISEEKIVTGGVAATTSGMRSVADTLYPTASVKK